MYSSFRVSSFRVFNLRTKEVLRLLRNMSNVTNITNGGRGVSRISRISSHLLCTSSNRTTIKSSYACKMALNSSGFKTEATELANDKVRKELTTQCLEQDDINVPNEAWTKDSLDLFTQLQNEADQSNGLWVKQKRKSPPMTGNRAFMRCLWYDKGKMFEYSMFVNKREERLKGICQFGPFTEGPSGYVHGGAIATVLDSVAGVCINVSGYKSVTANLSVDFKVGVPIGSTTLLEGRVDRVEGKKVYGSAEMKSPDRSITYATATALFVQVYHKGSQETKD